MDNLHVDSIINFATEGIIVANEEGKILLVNPYAEKMFGYEHRELKGQSIEILIPQSLRHKHKHHVEEFSGHPSNRSMGQGRDLYAKRKDDSLFPVEISLSPYASGDKTNVIAFIIDITIRKQSEEDARNKHIELEKVSNQVKKLNAELEQKVIDRTLMLKETLAQLERSKDELAESLEKEMALGELKSRFVSIVSHEFRTPLSTILSSASLIGKYITPEEQDKRERHVTRIKDSVKHMNNMLEDLLLVGKLEEGYTEAKPEQFIPTTFIQDFIVEMQELCRPGQHITSIVNIKQDAITSDKRLLKNILLNLASNAIKFSPENSEIVVSAASTEDGISISVKDQGIGISEEDQKHLFERFFRAGNAQNIQGTGLGLHIVSKYLELLQGTISIKSSHDNGSVFTITIPIHLKENLPV